MQIRIIDGQPFIVERQGKRESVLPPSEVVAAAHKCMDDAKAMLEGLDRSEKETQARLEAALIGAESTTPIRAELGAIDELKHDQQRELSDAQSVIRQVPQFLDQYKTSLIRQADSERIQALAKPFTDFLKEHA